MFCSYYIVGVKADKTVDLINSDDKLTDFIGRVDNEEELKLLARANGFYVSLDALITGAYKERANDYLLYLYDYSPKAGEVGSAGSLLIGRSIKAVLTKQGKFSLVESNVLERKL
jgi:hypothetical protein